MRSGTGMCLNALALAAVCGCASMTGGGRVAGKFPGRDELRRLEQTPPPVKMGHGKTVDVARWELTGPLPEAMELVPHHDDTKWGALLEKAAASRAGLMFLSESMHCAAREAGLFFLAHQALPARSLDGFILGRCGVAAGSVSTAWLSGDVPDGVDDGAVFAQWQDSC